MRYHDRRISYLEEIVRPQEREAEQDAAEARWQRSIAAWDRLGETMAPEHVQILIAEIGLHGHRYQVGDLGIDEEGGNLAQTASRMVFDYVNGRLQGPFTLPPEVAEIYATDPDAHRLHDCERCGYMLPVRTPIRGRTPHRYFDRCPLCNGRSGCNAYLYSQEGQIKRCQECGELHARTDAERRHLRRHGRPGCECSLPSERTEA